MIRVNLTRNRVGDAPAPAATSMGGMASSEIKEAAVKAAFILGFTLFLMVWENQNIRALQAQLQQLELQSNELQVKAEEKQKEVDAIKGVAKQASELEDKLKILKLLSHLRLREVKTLDFIQSSIPEKVWLQSVNYESDKENFELGNFHFTGSSVTTEDLTDFVKKLEDSAYLYEVIVVKNEEVKSQESHSSLRNFEFTAQVEVPK
jgi:Tfp pilus assembly protein PilN